MNRIDFEDFISYVVDNNTSEMISINGSMMMEVRRRLLTAGVICDFSPGAINTFAYHHPQSVTLSRFEIKVSPDSRMFKHLGVIRPVDEEIKKIITATWKETKILNDF